MPHLKRKIHPPCRGGKRDRNGNGAHVIFGCFCMTVVDMPVPYNGGKVACVHARNES